MSQSWRDSQAQSGTEPPSGQKGAGTINSPYDQGNAPENTTQSGSEPPSGQKGAGTLNSPYDGGNAPENPPAPTHQAVQNAVESPSTTNPGSGVPNHPPSSAQEQKVVEAKQQAEQAQNPTGAKVEKNFEKSTGAAADGGNFDTSNKSPGREADRLTSMDRDVSPGTREDGSHATTHGDKGEGYEPGGKFSVNRLKGKFGMGK